MNWKNTKKKIKEINNLELKKTFFPNYVFNKKIFRVMMTMLFFLFVSTLAINDFDFTKKFYYSCEGPSSCINPYYNNDLIPCPGDDDFCETPLFFAGTTIGKQPPWMVKNFGNITILSLIVAFIINHALYNKKELA